MFTPQRASGVQFQKNLKSTGAFVAFIATLATVIAFYVTLKTYHTHLEKQDQLTALLNNPNARVASGKKGKQVVKKLMAQNSEAAPKASSTDALEDLLIAAKAKKQADSKTQRLMSGYQAPRFEVQAPAPQPTNYGQPAYNYTLIEPEPMPRQVVAPAQPMWYPNFEVSAPIPVPQPVMAKVAIRNPEPMREPLPT